ncbi:hypothetical protein SLA2020_499900 [Shorea laevis]
MAMVVCQGLQLCLESQLVESRTLWLKFPSPRPPSTQPLELSFKSCSLESNTKEEMEGNCFHEENRGKTNNFPTPEMGGWSFLQALSITSQSSSEKTEKENTYVHPMMKRSLSTLSEKSLELCTENLGNETGSDINENNIFLLSSSSENSGVVNSPVREQLKHCQVPGAKKPIPREFPPPLTTRSGSESLQVRPHREDGRLVIKAVKVTSQKSIFQAERSNGRLRLKLWKDYSAPGFDSEEAAHRESEGLSIEVQKEEELESNGNIEEEEEEEWDSDGNSLEMGGEMGMEKIQRPGRCKEGEHEKKGLMNWTFCVAT